MAGAVVGVHSHVILDSTLYTDARPLFPVPWNPFLIDGVGFLTVYGGRALAGVLGAVAYVVRYWHTRTIE